MTCCVVKAVTCQYIIALNTVNQNRCNCSFDVWKVLISQLLRLMQYKLKVELSLLNYTVKFIFLWHDIYAVLFLAGSVNFIVFKLFITCFGNLGEWIGRYLCWPISFYHLRFVFFSHYPQLKATVVADTPELKRLDQISKQQSQVSMMTLIDHWRH